MTIWRVIAWAAAACGLVWVAMVPSAEHSTVNDDRHRHQNRVASRPKQPIANHLPDPASKRAWLVNVAKSGEKTGRILPTCVALAHELPGGDTKMNESSPQPETISRLFDAVYPSLAMLAGALDVQAIKLRPLLYALVVAGLLDLTGDRFANTAEGDHYLVRGKARYLGG
jgi:hypothetical protein